MKAVQFPMYCGGAILMGLHTWTRHNYGDYDRKEVIKKILENQETGNSQEDRFPYIPNNFDDFVRVLKHIFSNRNYGVVYAVTNPSEEEAAKFLSRAGFTKVGTFTKDGGNDCETWVIDFWGKLMPLLERVEFFGEHVKGSKFTTNPITMQAPVEAPVQVAQYRPVQPQPDREEPRPQVVNEPSRRYSIDPVYVQYMNLRRMERERQLRNKGNKGLFG